MRIRAKLGTKIMGGFILLLAMLLAVGLYSFFTLQSVVKEYNVLLDKNIPVENYIRDLKMISIEQAAAIRGYILYRDDSHKITVNNSKIRFDQIEEKIAGMIETAKSKEYLAKLEVAHTNYDNMTAQVIALVDEGRMDEAMTLANDARTYVNEIKDYTDNWIKWVEEVNIGVREEVRSAVLRENVIVLLIISVALVLGISIAIFLTLTITKPVRNVVEVAGQVADGNLTKTVTRVESGDEIEELSLAINQMIQQLRGIVEKIRLTATNLSSSSVDLSNSAKDIACATEQVSTTINELSDGVTGQAAESERTSSISAEMSANIQQLAASTENVSQSSMKVLKVATEGLDDSEKAVKKIEKIKGISMQTADVVKVLGEESERIGAILDVIKAISNQTNLLALNAAIEAARAGEHGVGFAVVADEVRKLAENSSESAGEIDKLIKKIQHETKRAIDIMDVSLTEVTEGVMIVNRAGTSFKSIVEEVDSVVEQLNQLAEVTQDIAGASNEVVRSIENVAEISEKSAAASQEVSAAAEEQTASMEEVDRSARYLADLARQLESLIAQFKY